MFAQQAYATSEAPAQAIASLTKDWPTKPDIVFAFCSSKKEPEALSQALASRFDGTPFVGCTTAGEHITGLHLNDAIVLTALYDTGIDWNVCYIPELQKFGYPEAEAVASELAKQAGMELESMEPETHFCLLFVDGLSKREEKLTALIADVLQGIPLAGGSAGDDLCFKQTTVISSEGCGTDAAVLVLGIQRTTDVSIVKHQHFKTLPANWVVTKADVRTRTVFELDGYPAAEAYARKLGISRDELTQEVAFLNPLIFGCNEELYVRSVQTINEDQSLTFYCAIEEGMVLELGGHQAMESSMKDAVVPALSEPHPADFVLVFNCILRALEAKEKGELQALTELLSSNAKAVTGFDTYGEQLDGLHINQTLLAVIFRDRKSNTERAEQ